MTPFTTTRKLLQRRITTAAAVVLAVAVASTAAIIGTPAPAQAAARPQVDAPFRMTVDATHPMLITQVVMGHNIGFDQDFARDNNQRGWNIGGPLVPQEAPRHRLGLLPLRVR